MSNRVWSVSRRTRVAGVVVTSAAVLAACGGGGNGNQAGNGGAASPGNTVGGPTTTGVASATDKTHVLKTTAEAIHILDPTQTIDNCNVNGLANIYDQLVRQTPNGSAFVPGLAKSWNAPNPKTFIMNLQPNVKFQDGTPFNAQAVADAIKRAQTNPTSTLKTALSVISSVTTPNALTVQLNLNRPVAGTMPGVFAGLAGEIPSPAAVAKAGSQYGVTGAVGAGPYKVTSFAANVSLNMAAWPGYWDPSQQTFAGVDFLQMNVKSDTLRPAQVQQGSLDMTAIKDSEIDLVKGKSGLKYTTSPSTQFAEIWLDYGVAPWNNPLVREALEYAVNKPALVAALTGNLDKVASQPLPPTQSAYNSSIDNMYTFDPTKAKQLLAQAGYPNGVKITIGEIEFDYYQRLTQAVQQMLEQSGFHVTLGPITPTAVNDEIYNQVKYNAAVTAFAGTPFQGTTLSQLYGQAGAYNPSHTKVPAVENLLNQAASTSDPTQQAAIYQQTEKVIMTNALAVPLFFNNGVSVYNPNVANVTVGQTTCAQANFTEAPAVFYKSK